MVVAIPVHVCDGAADRALRGWRRWGWLMNYLNDNRLRAEFFGTLCLVLIGCSSIVLSGFNIQLPIGIPGHRHDVRPDVCGDDLRDRPDLRLPPQSRRYGGDVVGGPHQVGDAIAYVVAQFIGAIVGALILYLIISGRSTGWDPATQGLGQNGWQDLQPDLGDHRGIRRHADLYHRRSRCHRAEGQ